MLDDDGTRRRTAIHEAGHAVWAVLLRRPLKYVSVEPIAGSLGRTAFLRRHALDLRDHRQVEREVALYVAGVVAEIIDDPTTVPTGATDEVWYAFVLVTKIGRGRRGFEEVVKRTARMLNALWWVVLAVAGELERRGALDGRVVRRLIRAELQLDR
jgi:hypothetical protein